MFFFQAEDGIRDADVTGVQTCALPILDFFSTCIDSGLYSINSSNTTTSGELVSEYIAQGCVGEDTIYGRISGTDTIRSEERRVGIESRTRSWVEPLTKQQVVYNSNNYS